MNFSQSFQEVLGKFAFQLLNGIGDFLTLGDVISPDGPPDWSSMTEEQITAKVFFRVQFGC